jgi:hypothetical protein
MAGINGPKIPTNGLILYLNALISRSYPGSGLNWFDLTRTSNIATLNPSVGGPTYSSVNGGVIVCDGSNDYVLTNNVSLSSFFNTTTAVTFTMWFYPTSAGQILTELASAALEAPGYHVSTIEISSAGAFSFSIYTGGFQTITSSNRAFNTWYFLTLTHDGSTETAYINGISIGTRSYTRSGPFSSGLGTFYGLCARDTTNMGTLGYAGGRIANFAIYNRALSSVEVLNTFNAFKTRFSL